MKKEIIDCFFTRQGTIDDRYVASRFSKNDRLHYDQALAKRFLNPTSTVLDLGCGTGLMEDVLHSLLARMVAVDKYSAFLLKTVAYSNVEYCCADIANYLDSEQYDVILLFGVAMYLSDEELTQTLTNAARMLKDTGTLIIKNQWGVAERVIVDGYSDGLQSDYYAIYRSVSEMDILLHKLGFSIVREDIYPAEMNLWENTHEYAFICRNV